MTQRSGVYHAVDTERDYQDKRWGGSDHDANKSIGDWLIYMDHYMTLAKDTLTTDDAKDPALEQIRKVVALGVACMEVHGAPRREKIYRA